MTDGDLTSRSSSVRDAAIVGLERVATRTRENGITGSAWCLSMTSRDGTGTITALDAGSGPPVFRGAGIFLGWSQRELEEAYRRWRPPPAPPESDAGQFG